MGEARFFTAQFAAAIASFAALVGGCATTSGKAEVVLAGAAPPRSRLKSDFVSAAYLVSPAATSIYLSDVPLDTLLEPGPITAQVAHVEILWRPVPGQTPVEVEAINASIRHVILVGGDVGIYGGAGFAWISGSTGAKRLKISTEGATIALLQATDGFKDLLSPAEYSGQIVAVNDQALAMRIRQAIAQRVTDAFGVPRFVQEPRSDEGWQASIGAILDPLNAASPSRGFVDLHQGSAHRLAAFPHLVGSVHPGGHVPEHLPRVAPDDAVVGPAHADIGDERRAAAQDAGISGRDVGMRSEDRGDAAVQMVGQRSLFAGGLHVGLDDDDRIRFGKLAQHAIRGGEGIICGERKPDSPEHRHHENAARPSSGGRNPGPPSPDRALGKIGRSGDWSIRHLQHPQDSSIPIAVVTQRDRIDAEGPERVEDLWGQPAAGSGILRIGHNHLRAVLRSEAGKLLLHDPPSRRPVEVSQEGE